ncbi:hypothetical protein [Geoalkalibacter subterraneus]|uniref:hypothetical protein n=1 Tax=Geoalkalibacter subterraneus TaxID=483547 RepID=UPI0013923045|nr:hypothetical protein [Geoalkalibacter subterraneus]
MNKKAGISPTQPRPWVSRVVRFIARWKSSGFANPPEKNHNHRPILDTLAHQQTSIALTPRPCPPVFEQIKLFTIPTEAHGLPRVLIFASPQRRRILNILIFTLQDAKPNMSFLLHFSVGTAFANFRLVKPKSRCQALAFSGKYF